VPLIPLTDRAELAAAFEALAQTLRDTAIAAAAKAVRPLSTAQAEIGEFHAHRLHPHVLVSVDS
jgi:hypothetical protein